MESFRKERFNEAEEITRLNMGLGTNVRLPSVFSADLSKIYRKFLYVHDFDIVAWPVQLGDLHIVQSFRSYSTIEAK